MRDGRRRLKYDDDEDREKLESMVIAFTKKKLSPQRSSTDIVGLKKKLGRFKLIAFRSTEAAVLDTPSADSTELACHSLALV